MQYGSKQMTRRETGKPSGRKKKENAHARKLDRNDKLFRTRRLIAVCPREDSDPYESVLSEILGQDTGSSRANSVILTVFCLNVPENARDS